MLNADIVITCPKQESTRYSDEACLFILPSAPNSPLTLLPFLNPTGMTTACNTKQSCPECHEKRGPAKMKS